MNKLILSTLLLLCTLSAAAQSYYIKGSVSDTVNANALEFASVTLMRASDSVLTTFTRTDQDGKFSLNVPKKDKYLLMITFPSFVDYVDKVDVTKEETNLGEIPLVSRTHLMKEFVFTEQVAAIKVKGDTIEYVADSFKVKDNATVESLLRRLPGIQVDKDGNIVAQGTQVQKVLVDGEEFFTDDPAVVSKSLQAKAVDKVQVFDKKSDEAEFTGIDDGQRTKTINLKLKDNMKRGYFGKLKAGGGAGDGRDYFENQGMINAFKGKRKISAFGIMANTGTIGLGWEDRDKFSSNDENTVIGDDGYITTYYSSDDFESWDGQYNGRGYPKAWTGGLHYSNKWNEDKHHLSGTYRYAKQNLETVNNTLAEYTLPDDSVYYSKTADNTTKVGQRNRVGGMYEVKLDSLSTIKVTGVYNKTNTITKSTYTQQTLAEDGSEINSSRRRTTNDGTATQINSSITYRKKFKKDRRTISASLSENYEERTGEGLLNSVNIYNSIVIPDDTFDQHKLDNNTSLRVNGYVSYTEPLTKDLSLSTTYSLAVNNTSAERNTFNKANANSDAYDVLDSTFSSNYSFNVLTHAGKAFLRYSHDKKINASVGMTVSNANFEQNDLRADTSRGYSFVNFFPAAHFSYSIKRQTRLRFSYNGSTSQPTLEQIQPLRNNINPLFVTLGNASLTQEFRHNVSLGFNDYKVLSARYIWASANATFTDNAISRSQTTDSIGRTITQYINVDGNFNAYGGISIGKRIQKLNTSVGTRLNSSFGKSNNVINGVKNTTTNNTYRATVYANYESEDEKLFWSVNIGGAYNDNSATISTQLTSYWTMENSFEVSYDLPWKVSVGTDVNWYVRERTQVFDRNNNVLRWNAFVSKKFLKNDQLELRASVFDILNQNLGFQRYAYNNTVSEQNYNTIRRYGMIMLTWNFTKTAMGAQQDDAANMIIQN